MNRLILLLLVGIVALVSGCVEPPPQRHDPLADLTQSTASTYQDLAVGVISSRNNESVLAYIKKVNPAASRFAREPALLSKDFLSTIQRSFKRVVELKQMEDAKAFNVDLIAVLDLYVELPDFAGGDVKVETGVSLLTTDKEQIDVVRGVTVNNAWAVSSFGGTYDYSVGKALDITVRQALDQLETALRGSVKLAEFSTARTAQMVAARPQVSPPPIAPSAKVAPSDISKPTFDVADRIMGDNDVAVVIGVEKYQDLPASDFSAKDAKLVKDYLTSLGVRERNIDLLLNERATQSSIRKSLESWLPNRVKKDSKVFVYYSGHGAPDPATGEAYLVPHDGDANYLSTTGYPLKGLYEKLGTLPAAEIVVVLDACFSGAGGRSVLAKGARPLVVMREGPAIASNMAVLAATQGAQISTSSPDKGHGILTYYFLKAIKDGKKNLAEIYSTIRPQVEDEAKLLNVAQTPSLMPEPEKLKGKFVLRK